MYMKVEEIGVVLDGGGSTDSGHPVSFSGVARVPFALDEGALCIFLCFQLILCSVGRSVWSVAHAEKSMRHFCSPNTKDGSRH